ncbi:Transcriptional regulator CRZ1 [Neofusicoccum parvum]|nr:Transcriptional regulator CRZ1 [Neofusicoccum parvum]
MASTGAFTPSSTHTGPFPPAPQAPDTPTSVSPVQQPIGANAFKGRHAQTPQITLDPSLPSPTTANTPKSPAFKLTPGYSPQPLTGAAAMAEERRHLDEQRAREMSRQVSPNPAVSALNNLLGTSQMSKMRDAPAAVTTLAEPIAKAARNIQIPESVTGENMQTSPPEIAEHKTSQVSLLRHGLHPPPQP